MEAAASVAVAPRGISMAIPSSRKEWRVVSDHPVQNPGNEDLDRSKLGQGDERLIYEVQQGRESLDPDLFSVTVACGSDHELRLEDVVKQREQLQHLEVNLKARLIARSQVVDMQGRFDSQIKEHITANLKLQEQLHEREKTIQDLQRTLEDKDEELHAIRLDHEAAWAKEDLLREQNKELATFRRERDNSEAERTQHLEKIHELQEHIQEKDQQLIEMQEQHRVAQETIIYKDEQIREAQAWITRAQEMDVLQTTTNHSLQAELRERMEQYNQLWLGCQRQFAELERIHLHALQQLQLELSEAKERSGTYMDETRKNHFGHSKESEEDGNGGTSPADISKALQNGNAEIVSTGNALKQTNQIFPAAQMAQSLHGMPPFLSSGRLTALHPFVMHQQGVPQNVNTHLVQSHAGQLHPIPAHSTLPNWQNKQALLDGSQVPSHEHHPSQSNQHMSSSDTNFDNQESVTGRVIDSDYSDDHISQGTGAYSVVPAPTVAGPVHDNVYTGEAQSQHILEHISLQFQGSLKLNHSDHDNWTQENANTLSNHGGEAQSSTRENLGSAMNATEAIRAVKLSETMKKKAAAAAGGTTIAEGFVGIGQRRSSVAAEMTLLDEESLLACVVRTIPPGPGGRIRISETLLNRLNKMLVPLNWADYKSKYGELDDFLAVHPELFLIEGDDIQVREGAQEIIAAMAAHAKVRAAAAAMPCNSSVLLSSVAVTPMAQSRLKKARSINSSCVKAERLESSFIDSQLLGMQNQLPNGVSSVASVRIFSKHSNDKNVPEIAHHLPNGNNRRTIVVKSTELGTSQSKVIGRVHGKHQARSAGVLPSSRR